MKNGELKNETEEEINRVDVHTLKRTIKNQVDDKADIKDDNTIEPKENSPNVNRNKCPCSVNQLLAIMIPSGIVCIFVSIFVPVYLTQNKDDDTIFNSTEKYDEFDESIEAYNYATLTPKEGYNNIYIHLNGIGETANTYFDFFKSKKTIIPSKTKIISLTGSARPMQYVIHYYGSSDPVPAWFNVDQNGQLYCDSGPCNDFTESKTSLNYILDKIDQISQEENIGYDKIYLGGFSQGGIMTSNVLLNSRHKLGGYLIFSGYIFDEHFDSGSVTDYASLSSEQKDILESKKDYHIIATHSLKDTRVFYDQIIKMYYNYFQDYTDFQLYTFGELDHYFAEQPVLPLVRIWLKKSMNK